MNDIRKTEEKIYRMCNKCGKKKYPNAPKDMGAITVSSGTCPVCGEKNVFLIPVLDWEGLGD